MGQFTRRIVLAGAALAAVVLTGCEVPRPAGDGTVRYRDVVFSTYGVERDIQYGSAPDLDTGAPEALTLDLYRPAGDTATRRPVLIWAHGGSFVGGDKRDGGLQAEFAKRGYVTASINYRMHASAPCQTGGAPVTERCFNAVTAATHDAQAAVRWMRAHAAEYGIDPTRIVMAGSSAGAIIATAVGVRGDEPGSSGTPGPSSRVQAFISVSGGLPGGLFVTGDDAPGLFFHGTADPVVPAQYAADTAAALLKAGVPSILQLTQGGGHSAPPDTQHFLDQSAWYAYLTLKLGG